MSFGFSIGDFVTVIGLANKIRKEFAGAPSQFDSISDEVRSLSIVLQDADVTLSECEPDQQQKGNLQEIVESCHRVLVDLEKTLAKYIELETPRGDIGKKVKRVWKRLRWEPEDIHELRGRLTSNVTLLHTFIGQMASQATFATKKGIDRLNKQQDDHERLTILDWLTPVDYAPQQSDFINRRQAGTGQWLLDSPKFQTWMQASKQTLFCPGIPGAGKTILTSIVVNELTTCFGNDASVGIAYVYCNFRRTYEQKAEDLLASLLKQLVQGQPSLPESVRLLYDKHKEKRTRPSFNEISKALQSVAAVYSKAFIIIDALDECQTSDGCRSKLLAEIFNLEAKCGVSFFATSRFIPDISDKFYGSTSLEIRASADDVRRYVDSHISRLPSFVGRSPDLKEEVVAGIVRAVDGMFLLAQLHLDSLIGKRSPKAVRAALAKLPSGTEAYDHAYQNAMQRIEGQREDQEELAKQVLSWITCAQRPLTTMELQNALAVEVGERELDKENLSQIEDIVSVCAGLVTVDEESSIIRLVHYTTQEYFERTQQQLFPNAGSEITRICATYLSFTVFGSGLCQTDADFEKRLHSNPFYDYAAQNWGYHARKALTLHQEVINFLLSHETVEASSQALMAVKQGPGHLNYSQHVPKQMTGLHLASCFGAEEAVKALLREQVDTDLKDSYGRTPMSWAARSGHEAVVKLLLDTEKVDVNSRDVVDRTPMSWAAIKGHEAVVKLLLDTEKVDIDSKDNVGRTPLSWAAGEGHEAIVKLLLDTEKVDVNSRDVVDRTPLSWAASGGNEAIVKLLLDSEKVDVDSKNDYGRTPLSWAAGEGHEAIVKLLLDIEKVDVDSKNDYGWTPLFYTAARGYKAVVKLLLDTKRVDVDLRDGDGRTPLSYAAREGYEAVVKLLLDTEKVDVNSKDNYGRTPLSWAAERGSEAVVKLLLDTEKVDADSKDNIGRTPLSFAAKMGHRKTVMTLVSNGSVDPDPKDYYGSTPLSIAVRNHQTEVAKGLLDTRRIDCNSQDRFGRTPLWYARRYGSADIAQLVLENTGKGGILVCEKDLPMEGGPRPSDEVSRWCDACTLGIRRDEAYYHCKTCNDGDFDVCLDCYGVGGRCLEADHELVRRRDQE